MNEMLNFSGYIYSTKKADHILEMTGLEEVFSRIIHVQVGW